MTRLEELERQIEDDIESIGLSLAEIKRDKLYKPRTWEAYCQERWGWSDEWCNIRIKAAQKLIASKPENPTKVGVSESKRPTIKSLAGVSELHHEALVDEDGEVEAPTRVRTLRDSADPRRDILRMGEAVGTAHAHIAWNSLGRIDDLQESIVTTEEAIELLVELREALQDESSLRSEITDSVDRGLSELLEGGE